jgi:hypothetical protein
MRFLLPTPDPATETVLQQLHRADWDAVLRGDRLTAIVARLSWAETYLTAYGTDAAAFPNLTKAALHLLPEEAVNSPIWSHRYAKNRLVMVDKREEYFISFGYKRKAKMYREFLSCGHVIEVPADIFGADPPKRRRCADCGYQRDFKLEEVSTAKRKPRKSMR